MFDRLTLANFQRHAELVVEFGPAVTTLVGPNDVGKSAVLRALRWLCLNAQPTGVSFIKRGQDDCGVRLLLAGGVEVCRLKGKGHNSYHLAGERYVSFGRGVVPDAVAAVLRTVPANFQRQLDLHFWFAKTPSQLCKELNDAAGLSLIDGVTADLASSRRACSAAISVGECRTREAKRRVVGLAWVGSTDKLLKRLEGLETTRDETARKTARLATLTADGRRYARTARRSLALAKLAVAVASAGADLDRVTLRARSLRDLLGDYKTHAAMLVRGGVPSISKLETATSRLDDHSRRLQRLQTLTKEAKWQLGVMKEQASQITRLEKKVRTLSPRGTCPLCGNPLTKTPS